MREVFIFSEFYRMIFSCWFLTYLSIFYDISILLMSLLMEVDCTSVICLNLVIYCVRVVFWISYLSNDFLADSSYVRVDLSFYYLDFSSAWYWDWSDLSVDAWFLSIYIILCFVCWSWAFMLTSSESDIFFCCVIRVSSASIFFVSTNEILWVF